MKRLLTAALALLLILIGAGVIGGCAYHESPRSASDSRGSSGLRIVGYVTYWQMDRLPNVKLRRLTHLVWQGVMVASPEDPSLYVPDDYPLSQIRDAVDLGHGTGIKVLASIMSPNGSADFNAVIESSTLRVMLVENVRDLVVDYGLDGIDVDAESYPNVSTYSEFLKALHEALDPLGKIVSIAASPDRIDIEPAASQYLSFISVMTYDLYKGVGYPYHSLYYESISWLNYWADAGIPKDKLLMGIPLYGRDKDGGYHTYRSIVDTYGPTPSTNHVSDPSGEGAIIWWNGADLVRRKVHYVKDSGFGGVMLYEVGADMFDNRSLLLTVFEEVTRSP